jgi:hypothetical protein
MKICPVGAELCYAERQTDGQTYMAKQIVTFRNSANAPKTVNDQFETICKEAAVFCYGGQT